MKTLREVLTPDNAPPPPALITSLTFQLEETDVEQETTPQPPFTKLKRQVCERDKIEDESSDKTENETFYLLTPRPLG